MKEGGFCTMSVYAWRHLPRKFEIYVTSLNHIIFVAVTWRMVFRLATRWTLWLALMQVSMETRTISMTGSDVTLTKERSQVKSWNPLILMTHSICDNLKESSNFDDSFNLWQFEIIQWGSAHPTPNYRRCLITRLLQSNIQIAAHNQ